MTADIQQVNIEREMRDAYLDYAMSVIVSRALPDARDGLKPVHRRILYAMYDMGLRADTPHRKSARIVGEVLGKYHPHGDMAVYESMVRMAQDFSMRYLLVEGQGNFGSIDGDSAAAMRYTEARMGDLGEELLVDITKQTVDFAENFDGSLQEPTVLPASIPNLLVNGASGIAVGMSTNIPPHNLTEVVNALGYMLENWDDHADITVQDLMTFIKGPDFPTGGIVYRHSDGGEEEDTLVTAYATGQGKLVVRAKAHVESMGRGKSSIIVSELPYQVNKTTLVERIAKLVHDGKLEGLSDLRDESDRNGMRLVIELQRGVNPADIMPKLFKLTPMQDTFSIRMLALVDNQPRLLSLKQALKVYLDHRLEIVRRRSEYDLRRAQERAHILAGLLKALDDLDAVIEIIRRSQTVETARNNLMKKLSITEIQAQAILDMQLRRLASLERRKIKDEHDEKVKLIRYLEGLLGSPVEMRSVVAEELDSVRSAYEDSRRTIIVDSMAGNGEEQSLLLPDETAWITMTINGRLSRSEQEAPPKVTTATKEPPRFIMQGSTTQTVYLFTSDGRCATIPAQQLSRVDDFERGTPFSDLCGLSSSDEIVAMLSLPPVEHGYLLFATAAGQVKRIRMEDLPGMSSRPFVVMKVSDDDQIINVLTTDGQRDILLTTNEAQSIRFKEDDVRPTGLAAGGIRGVKLGSQRGRVVGVNIIDANGYVWAITDDGIAKISPVADYPVQGRAGGGVIAMRLPTTSREVVATAVGKSSEMIIVLSNKGKPKYMSIGLAEEIKRGRAGGKDVFAMSRKGEEVSAVVMYQPLYQPPDGLPADDAD
ncbi:MAG: DNA gyrase subunit A [Anaerolineaceae bacterium]|nr:MAG: DNA gyrase subunit A [Anaerolineaceae bacterium]